MYIVRIKMMKVTNPKRKIAFLMLSSLMVEFILSFINRIFKTIIFLAREAPRTI